MKTIYITIVDYHGKENTIECLESLEKMDTQDIALHVVIINNAEQGDISIEKKYKNFSIHIFNPHTNLGFSGGHNMGIEYSLKSGADAVLILNNDTIVHSNLIKELIVPLDHDKNVGIVSPKIYFAKGYEFHKDRYKEDELGKVFWYAGGIMDWKNVIGHHRGVDEVDMGQYNTVESTDFASGCCLLVTREVFERVGIFNELYFLYYEDTDLSERVKRAGFIIQYIPQALLWHKNAASAGGSGSQLQDYFITRNRLLFGMKYAPVRSKIALLKESITILGKGREWQKKGVKDFYERKFGKGSFVTSE